MTRAVGRSGGSVIAGFVVFFVSLLVSAGPRAATEIGDARLGPLSKVATLDDNGPWKAALEDGYYTLANDTDPTSIRFFYLRPDPAVEGRRRLAVRVRIAAAKSGSLGGLLYGHRVDPLFYYAFGLAGDGRAVLYRRDAEGIGPVLETELGPGPRREALLAIEEREGELLLLVDGEEVGRFRGEGTGGGGTGIVAVGQGRFGFREFRVAEVADAGGAPGNGGGTPAETPPVATGADPATAFGPLAELVTTGESGVWRYGVEEGAFVLRNTTAADRFLRFTAPTPALEGRRLLRTTFTVESDAGTRGAGLAYADTDARVFFLLWTPDDEIVLERLEGDRTVPLRAWRLTDPAAGEHRLWLAEDGDIVVLGFDEEPLGFLRDPAFGGGRVGIVAFGTGTFRFSGFEVEPLTTAATPLPVAAPPPPAPPPPAPPQQPGPWGQPPAPQPGPWNQPPAPQPGPWGQPPQPQPGPWSQPPQQPGPWGQPPQPQPGPWNQPAPQPQPGPWGQPPQPQPGPWSQPPQQPGPWGQPPAPQPGPWGQPQPQPGPWGQQWPPPPAPRAPQAPFDQAALDRAIGDVLRFARSLVEAMGGSSRPAPSPPKGWKRYVDAGVPVVTLNHPPGWRVEGLAQRSPYGGLPAYADFRVTSPDGLHRLVARSLFEGRAQPLDPDDLLRELMAELGATAEEAEVLREERFTGQSGTPGMPPAEGQLRAVRVGDHLVVGFAGTLNMAVPGAGAFSVLARARAVAGPADRFAEMSGRVYLPLLNSTIAW